MIIIGLIATTAFEKQSLSHNLSSLKYLNKCLKSFRISIASLNLNDDLIKIR